MRLLVFVRGEHAPYASAPDVAHKGCGIGDTLGNKGAIGAAFRVHGTTLCFVCCHLEAFQGEVFGRNSDFSQVVDSLRLGRKDLDALHQFDHVFWFGDLNYRVDLPQSQALDLLDGLGACDARERAARLAALRGADQLDVERSAGRAFAGFEEAAAFNFPPTYRYMRKDGARDATTGAAL
ncbi:hypothetical protein JL720_5927 [Aureococcus anophagefferens]|nr:hypothetical protein JL720_5927 [Aureococcus anophagefferens]